MANIDDREYELEIIKKWDKTSIIHVAPLVNRIHEMLKSKPCINLIDIGSNTGNFTELLDNKIEVRNALLVEPIKEFLEYSKSKFPGRGFSYMNVALGEAEDVMRFIKIDESNENLGTSFLQKSLNETENSTSIIPFDDVNFQKFLPDIIKIDAEGMDFDIILGMLKYLDRLETKPLIIAESNGWASISDINAKKLLRVYQELGSLGYSHDILPKWSHDIVFTNEGVS